MSKPLAADLFHNTGRMRSTGIQTVVPGPVNDDWDVTAGDPLAGVIYADAAGIAAFVTGIAAADFAIGDELTIVNVSTATDLVFFDGDAGSAATNQLILPDRLPLILRVGQAVTFIRRAGVPAIWRVKDWSGTSKDPVHCLPPPSQFFPQTAYDPRAYCRMNNDGPSIGGGLVAIYDSVLNFEYPGVNGTGAFNRYIQNYLGILVAADGRGWALAGANTPGNASQVQLAVFSMVQHSAADIGIIGYDDIADTCCLLSMIQTADDKVAILVSDVGAAHSATIVINHAITFGQRYLLVYHINRTTDLLYTRLVNLDTRTAFNGVPLDISAYGTIQGGVDPLWQVGAMVGRINGTGVTHLGWAVLDQGVEDADVVTNLTKRLAGV